MTTYITCNGLYWAGGRIWLGKDTALTFENSEEALEAARTTLPGIVFEQITVEQD